jgi:hypothetical protein
MPAFRRLGIVLPLCALTVSTVLNILFRKQYF